MRDLHSRMLTALLEGEGLRAIAGLAAEEAGAPVAIVLPARGLAAGSSDELELEPLIAAAAARLRGDGEPLGAELEVEVQAGGELIGYALALPAPVNGMPRIRVDREEVLRTAALAAIAEVAVAGARDAPPTSAAACSRTCERVASTAPRQSAGPPGSAAT